MDGLMRQVNLLFGQSLCVRNDLSLMFYCEFLDNSNSVGRQWRKLGWKGAPTINLKSLKLFYVYLAFCSRPTL